MIILNAGVPRSGTVLVNAILRRLLATVGATCVQSNPHGAQLTAVIRQLQDSGRDRHGTTLIHTHSWTREAAAMLTGAPHVTGFVNFRDPRDVCASLMRLHDHDFDQAAQMTENAFVHFEATARTNLFMVIPYERLVADRQGHIFQMARWLGLWPGLDQIAEIDAATSIDRHRAVMEQVQAGTLETLARRKNRNRVLVEDRATLINDRHIQSGQSGRWREDLSSDQHRVANERFEPILKRYGYDPE